MEAVADNKIVKLVEESGLEPAKGQALVDKFGEYSAVAADWEAKAKTIVVTDASQTADMKMARVGRLELRQMRITVEKTRKELKEQSLREGRAIDGIAKMIKGLIEPIESYLDEQEHFVEIEAKKEAERIRIEEEAKAEAARIAKEKAEREEQERIRLENIRLQKEAEEKERERLAREHEIEVERAKAEAKAQAEKEAARLKAEAEKQALIDKAEREKREAAEKLAAQERAIAEERRRAEEAEAARKAAEVECPNCHTRFVPEQS